LLIYAGFTIYPVLRTFYNAFFTIKPQGVVDFVGFGNFTALLFADPTFWKAVTNTALFTIVATIVDVIGGLLLALVLFARAPLAPLLRVVWFTPVLMSYVVVGIIWVWMYDYDWGLANATLRWLGLGGWEQSWLGHHRRLVVGARRARVEMARLQHDRVPGRIARAARRGARRGGARQLRLARQARLHHRPDAAHDGRQPDGAVVHRQDDGLRPDLGDDRRRTVVGDGNGVDLRLQARLRVEHVRSGYPSAIAVLWFIIILAFIAIIARVFRQRDKLEF
jgi:hypothetical protein